MSKLEIREALSPTSGSLKISVKVEMFDRSIFRKLLKMRRHFYEPQICSHSCNPAFVFHLVGNT